MGDNWIDRLDNYGKACIIDICHKMWCAFMLGAGLDFNSESTEHQKESIWDGICYYVSMRGGVTGEMLWMNWKQYKIDSGWTYGVVKSEMDKTHPNLVDRYESLSEVERNKDAVSIMAWGMAVRVVTGIWP